MSYQIIQQPDGLYAVWSTNVDSFVMIDALYLNPTTREVMGWMDRGLCPWCGGSCPGDQCYARKCDSCTEVWLASRLADVDEGHVLTIEDCPPCVIWWANLHLENPALSSAPADWMRPTTEVVS